MHATGRTILHAICALFCVVATGKLATAADFPLTVDLRHAEVDDYGLVHVEEDGAGGLIFSVELDPEILGPRAHLRDLHFNLDGDLTGLEVLTHDPVPRRYRLRRHGGFRHGTLFDVSISFGSDRGRRSNGTLQEVSFSLVADDPLSVDDLLPMSFTRRGEALHMAASVMRASHKRHGYTVFLGAVYEPEPEPEPELEPEVPPGCELVLDLLTREPVIVCP
jgi:hypothetical protein